MVRLPEELVELIFDKLLQQYPPDPETKTSLFAHDDEQALSALTLVSLVAARRTRTHRFKCVVLASKPKVKPFFERVANFLKLSFASQHRGMGRLLPIPTITTNIRIIVSEGDDRNPILSTWRNDDRLMALILRLRNDFHLKELTWYFASRFESSQGFHRRFVGLLLSSGIRTLCIQNFTASPDRLQGQYIPGTSFDRTFRFGEEDWVDPKASPTDIYPSYT